MIKNKAVGKLEIVSIPNPADNYKGKRHGGMGTMQHYRGELDANSSENEIIHLNGRMSLPSYCSTIQTISGTLNGRTGSFVLETIYSIANDFPELSVVLDSGTGDLTGLSGKMTITTINDNHEYQFDYMLPEN